MTHEDLMFRAWRESQGQPLDYAPIDYARDPIAFARHLIEPPKMRPWQRLAAAGRIVFAWARK